MTLTTEIASDLDAEQAVLGAMMASKDAIADVIETLPPRGDDGVFARPLHQTVYDAIIAMYSSGVDVDAVTLVGQLDRDGDLKRIGGAPYVHTLMTSAPSPYSAAHYAELVAQKCKIRRVIEGAVRVQSFAQTGRDADEVLDFAQEEMYRIGDYSSGQDVIHIGEYLDEAIGVLDAIASRSDQMTGVSTGLRDLDALTNGFDPGQLVIVAARPGVGKSTLGVDFVRSAARENVASVVFSLEMSRQELIFRILSAEARVDAQKLKTGKLCDDDWSRISRRQAEIVEWPLFIDDSPNCTIVDIRAKSRRLKQRNNVGLIVIDYLQLMTSGRKAESRQQEVSEISRQLKLLAKELEVPIVAISQLNRNAEQRVDKTPALADLRESGSLEQDADMVILIHRPDYSEHDSLRVGEADLIMAKHRGGPIATIPVAHQLHYSRFADLAEG